MRKIFQSIAFTAAAVALIVSCNKEEIANESHNSLKLAIRANSLETRTSITDEGDGTYTPLWGANDAIGVFFTEISNKKVFTNSDAGDIALFVPDKEITDVEGDQTLYSFYPNVAYNAAITGTTSIRVNVKTDQVPSSKGTFDPETDILVSKPYAANITTISEEGGVIDLQFARLLSVVKIIPTDATSGKILNGEYIKNVKISYDGTGDDAPLTGRVELDLNNGEFGNWTIKTYSVNASYDENEFILDGKNAAFLLVNPTTIASGKAVTFTIQTDKHDITKVINLTNDLAFPAGNIAKINLTLNDDCTIEDNSVDPNIVFSIPFYANISTNTTYNANTHGDLGVIGSSKSTISYQFSGTNQLRNNSNSIKDSGSFYWCAEKTGLVISGINVGDHQYFNLTFDRKVISGKASLVFSISKDNVKYYTISSVTASGNYDETESFNFSLDGEEYTNLYLKVENTGDGAVIDNLTLRKLDAAGDSNTEIVFDGNTDPGTEPEQPGGDEIEEEKEYSFAFATMGSTGWSSSYTAHTAYDDDVAKIDFASANKQSGTITDVPVTKGQPVTVVLKKGTMNSVSFTCSQWTTKAQTITLHYSTDGGKNYNSTGITSNNFSITGPSLPSGTNAVKITFSSADNQVGVNSVKFNYTY